MNRVGRFARVKRKAESDEDTDEEEMRTEIPRKSRLMLAGYDMQDEDDY